MFKGFQNTTRFNNNNLFKGFTKTNLGQRMMFLGLNYYTAKINVVPTVAGTFSGCRFIALDIANNRYYVAN